MTVHAALRRFTGGKGLVRVSGAVTALVGSPGQSDCCRTQELGSRLPLGGSNWPLIGEIPV